MRANLILTAVIVVLITGCGRPLGAVFDGSGGGGSGYHPIGDPCADMGGLQADAPWPTFQRCPGHAGVSPGLGPSRPELLWTARCPSRFLDGLAIDREGVVYGCGEGPSSAGAFTARRASDGQPLWTLSPAEPDEVFTGHPAILADGRVLAPTSRGLLAVSRQGERLWMVPTDAVSAIGAPLVTLPARILQVVQGRTSPQRSLLLIDPVGEFVDLVRCNDQYIRGNILHLFANPAPLPDGEALFAAKSGLLSGSGPMLLVECDRDGSCDEFRSFPDGRIGYPVIGSDSTRFIVYTNMPEERPHLLGLDKEGREVLSIVGEERDGETQYLFVTGPAPAIGLDGALYLTFSRRDEQARLRAYEPSGALRYEAPLSGVPSTIPVIDAEGAAYVAAGDQVFAFEPDGRERFRVTLPGEWPNALALDGNGRLIVQMPESLVAIGP